MTGVGEEVDPGDLSSFVAARRRKRARRGIRRRVLLIGAGVAVVLAIAAGATLWPDHEDSGAHGVQIDNSVEAVGPVDIVNADALLIWRSAPDLPVRIRVKNLNSQPVRTRVWWTVARPDQKQPWLNNVMQALPENVELGAGDAKTVTVPIPGGTIEPGFYRLSLWAHTYDTDTDHWVHSDGTHVLGLIQVAETSQRFDHVEDASTRLWIQTGDLPDTWQPGAKAAVGVYVVNALRTSQAVEVWWYLAPEGTKEPWTDPAAIRSDVVTTVVEPGTITRVDVPIEALPRAGRYELSLWLHKKEANATVAADGAYAKDPVSVADSADTP